jgi:hypothetical protein
VTNPVLQALANAREQEQEREHAMVSNAVAARLGISPTQGDKSRWPLWQAWCRAKGIDAFPVRPHVLAIYVLDNASLGIGELSRVVEAVSAMHAYSSDPTLSPFVSAALDCVAGPTEPPRSWDAEHRAMFEALPRTLKIYVNQREADRDKALRQAQNRKKDSKHGTQQQNTTAATGNTDTPIQN